MLGKNVASPAWPAALTAKNVISAAATRLRLNSPLIVISHSARTLAHGLEKQNHEPRRIRYARVDASAVEESSPGVRKIRPVAKTSRSAPRAPSPDCDSDRENSRNRSADRWIAR